MRANGKRVGSQYVGYVASFIVPMHGFRVIYYYYKRPVCRIWGDVLAEIEYDIISMLSLMYDHLKLRTVLFLELST